MDIAATDRNQLDAAEQEVYNLELELDVSRELNEKDRPRPTDAIERQLAFAQAKVKVLKARTEGK